VAALGLPGTKRPGDPRLTDALHETEDRARPSVSETNARRDIASVPERSRDVAAFETFWHDAGQGIENESGGNTELAPPVITGFGSVMGTACPNCTVDVYSDDEDEGRVYEGSTTADGTGNWTFGGSPQGPNVTATATAADGNTSEFSTPVFSGHSDEDGFSDAIEVYLGTDPLAACPDNSTDDAWPLDVDMSKDISVTGDIWSYNERLGATPGQPNWWQRLDLDQSGDISVTGDIFMYRGKLGMTCT